MRGESRHPEWDLMYRKGLTVGRIAVLCGAVGETVARHIRVQRAKFPEIQAEHVSNRPADKRRPARAGWLANVDALSAFRQVHGRYPTTGDADMANRRLAQWLSLQRRAERAGTLPEDRRRALSVLPGWANNQRAAAEAERWLTRLGELQAFRVAEDRWPRFRTPADEAERVLGVWLHGQRQSFGKGRLTRDQERLLNSVVPDWNAWRTKRLKRKPRDAGMALAGTKTLVP
jgi:hypothetical protein